jgi:hypothetical protein
MQIAVLGIDLGKNRTDAVSPVWTRPDVWSCAVGCIGTAWSNSRRSCLPVWWRWRLAATRISPETGYVGADGSSQLS